MFASAYRLRTACRLATLLVIAGVALAGAWLYVVGMVAVFG